MNPFYKLYCFIYPERCPYCENIIKAGQIACKNCQEKIDAYQKPIIRGTHGFRCVSSFLYDGNVRGMILRMKYRTRIQYARQVAAIMAKDIKAVYGAFHFDIITAVPMHKADQRERRYNQSQKLAKALAKQLGIPYSDTLRKVKRTKKQQSLNYQERKTNLIGAFQLIDKGSVKDKNILIIDDIITTGETLWRCSKELTKGKPRLICCATIANAKRDLNTTAII